MAFLPNIGGPELLIILFIVLLLFGAKKLPELAKGLGKSAREFKRATQGIEDDFRSAMDEVDPNKPASEDEKKPETASNTESRKEPAPKKPEEARS